MTKRFLLLVITSVLGLITGTMATAVVGQHMGSTEVVHGAWVSPAVTIAEEAAEADVIVRVQVRKVKPARKLETPLAAEAQQNGLRKLVTPFTDSDVEVVHVYKGSVGKSITLLQTGGVLAKTEDHPAMGWEVEGDPRFVEGTEHVLFLDNISGDQVHAKDRQLYRIVNPAGRYGIAGNAVQSHAEFPQSYTPPQTLQELEAQIQQALTSN